CDGGLLSWDVVPRSPSSALTQCERGDLSEKTRLRSRDPLERRTDAHQDDVAYRRELLLEIVRVVDWRRGSLLDRLGATRGHDIFDLVNERVALGLTTAHARSP